jgi:hypothetical protein
MIFMFHKLVVERNPEPPVYIKGFTPFNQMPEPAFESNLEEYFNYAFSYTPILEEFKQVIIDGMLYNTLIAYFHDRAYALLDDRANKTIKVYKIGCEHDFEETKIGNNLTHYKCKKCGYERTIDSSD